MYWLNHFLQQHYKGHLMNQVYPFHPYSSTSRRYAQFDISKVTPRSHYESRCTTVHCEVPVSNDLGVGRQCQVRHNIIIFRTVGIKFVWSWFFLRGQTLANPSAEQAANRGRSAAASRRLDDAPSPLCLIIVCDAFLCLESGISRLEYGEAYICGAPLHKGIHDVPLSDMAAACTETAVTVMHQLKHDGEESVDVWYVVNVASHRLKHCLSGLHVSWHPMRDINCQASSPPSHPLNPSALPATHIKPLMDLELYSCSMSHRFTNVSLVTLPGVQMLSSSSLAGKPDKTNLTPLFVDPPIAFNFISKCVNHLVFPADVRSCPEQCSQDCVLFLGGSHHEWGVAFRRHAVDVCTLFQKHLHKHVPLVLHRVVQECSLSLTRFQKSRKVSWSQLGHWRANRTALSPLASSNVTTAPPRTKRFTISLLAFLAAHMSGVILSCNITRRFTISLLAFLAAHMSGVILSCNITRRFTISLLAFLAAHMSGVILSCNITRRFTISLLAFLAAHMSGVILSCNITRRFTISLLAFLAAHMSGVILSCNITRRFTISLLAFLAAHMSGVILSCNITRRFTISLLAFLAAHMSGVILSCNITRRFTISLLAFLAAHMSGVILSCNITRRFTISLLAFLAAHMSGVILSCNITRRFTISLLAFLAAHMSGVILSCNITRRFTISLLAFLAAHMSGVILSCNITRRFTISLLAFLAAHMSGVILSCNITRRFTISLLAFLAAHMSGVILSCNITTRRFTTSRLAFLAAHMSGYSSSHPTVYEKDTKIFAWNCALHSSNEVVFDCCAHAHVEGSGGKAELPGRESTVTLAVPALTEYWLLPIPSLTSSKLLLLTSPHASMLCPSFSNFLTTSNFPRATAASRAVTSVWNNRGEELRARANQVHRLTTIHHGYRDRPRHRRGQDALPEMLVLPSWLRNCLV
uniref:Uncharacterized protein n=1 Tax=Timema shepardi TaxID=629360 RepID=A0A7R9AXI9_TIMSH|nr:unnamed protein product [Timema shepardi]